MGLDVKSIQGIIEACGKNGVADLKFGDLEISFFVRKGLEDRPHLAGQEMPTLQSSTDPYASQASGQSEVSPGLNPVDQELLDDLARSQRLIDDPLGYESEIVNQFLRGERE